VTPRNLSDEAYASIRAAILGRQIQPGSRLFETDLATSLGVSRGPVREALRQLEQEGLVRSFPRRGAIVVALPEDEIEAFYELRADIEARAFARACERVTPQDLDELSATLDDLSSALALGDVDAITTADMRFHRTVMDLSGFTLLKQMWSSLEGPLRIRVYQFTEAELARNGLSEQDEPFPHAMLLDALRRGDPDHASAVARGHVLAVRESIRALQRAPDPGRPAGT